MAILRNAVALLVVVAACAPSAQPVEPARAPSAATSRVVPRAVCPSQLPGVTVTSVDTPNGIAVEFRTAGDADELWRRVERLARAHNDHNARAREALAQEATRRSIARALPPGVDSSEVFEASGPGGEGRSGMDSEGPDLGNETEPRMGPLVVVIPTTARATPLFDGGRLLLAPHDPENLGELRGQVRERMALLQMGECPVLA